MRQELIIAGTMLAILFSSCQKNDQPQLIAEKTFVQIYCDVVTHLDLVEVSLRQAFIDSVLNSYQVSYNNYLYTKNSFAHDPKKWQKIFEAIVSELERRKSELDLKSEIQKTNQDNRKSAGQN